MQSVLSHSWQTVFINANIATMTQAATSYGTLENAALAIADGKIAWLGHMSVLPTLSDAVEVVDVHGMWLTPGLIDCHTHIVYGGNRANEFEMRLQGASYEEIAESGGGIVSTVKATRAASEDELYASAFKRLNALHNEGVTSLEIKSGYGLDLDTELKMLRVAKRLGQALPVSIEKTFLGAHALPTEYQGDSDGYIDLVCNTMIPEVAKQGLADAVDVFCEGIGFNIEQTEAVFTAASEHGIRVKVHAEQLSDLGGSELAARYNALSSDHLEYLSESGAKAMSGAGMVAVLLPGAFYFLRETKLPPLQTLRDNNVRMAIASDANPGSSPINSIQLMLNMACTLFRMTPNEALAGVTCNAARALGIDDKVGELAIGMDADIAMWDIKQPAELCYQYGVNPLAALYKGGQKVS
ncbi:imidazolonepropionase [Thalassotalea sp. HSM 43]|uniref:imidazolonepropionase n=1 Tax=Thalassotalea sp. HSM 43 TaxID=2552945 RepID=UPI00108079F5|nr:imidazolonepropionase [Thalassotalea sp. HSM 43]QBY03863.1 imidazolonepropionase [Thalassotalea sp. HSM 43]